MYPERAVSARMQGVVTLDVTIGSDGTVDNPVVLTSIPLLDQAAVDAVRQWRYEPPRQRVPIIMTVTVAFTLQ